MNRSRLTIFTKALDSAANLERVLPNYRDVADEVVVGIDSATRDHSWEVARKYADRIFSFPHGCAIGGGLLPRSIFFDHLFPHCGGDWILQLDHDETLSAEWSDRGFLDEILNDRLVTHAFLPRRWALPGGKEYISSRHWTPDFQMRLFRNLPSLLKIHENLHDRNQMAGMARFEPLASLIHWDLAWTSREQRLRRVQSYARRSSYTGREYYLYEYQPYATRPLEEPLSGCTDEPVFQRSGHESYRAAIQVKRAPEWIFAGEPAWMLISIHNGSNRVLKPDFPMVQCFGIYVSYHWLTESGEMVVFDGERSALPRQIAPGGMALGWISLRAPEAPGNYVGQLDLVEEGVSWFGAHVEIPVEVLPFPAATNWYPELD